jgi:ribosome-associated protein
LRAARFAEEDFDLTPHHMPDTAPPAFSAQQAQDAGISSHSAAPFPESPTLACVSAALEDMKAEEIVTIDLMGKTSLADAMIIATGRSNRHVSAISDRVVEFLKQAGQPTPRVEGQPHCDWVLIDAGDVIVHVFRPDVRQFYNLEKMWSGDRPVEQPGDLGLPRSGR